jgi:hypothetical protein
MQKLSRTYSLIWFMSILAGHEITVLQFYQLQTKVFPDTSVISKAMPTSFPGIETTLLRTYARVTTTIIVINSYISRFCLNTVISLFFIHIFRERVSLELDTTNNLY